ncbi:MAG TPA: glycosyltransferase family 4 protein [Gemmatimonadaceae bacterium]|nr:glycosyltransferase family 4 protein [Gemmatimonadaceae bacterium]
MFFANPNSVHVRRWLQLAESAGIEIEGWSVERLGHTIGSNWKTAMATGGAFRYAIAGLLMRLVPGSHTIVHAHSASGYGLMAWLSGRRYVLTVYGSDVYLARQRGLLYQKVLRKVLRRALLITCTTPAMREHLQTVYGIDAQRIRMFSLGIPLERFYLSIDERDRTRHALGFERATVITSNRRMRAQYRIDLIVRAFSVLSERDAGYRLILFEGDSEPGYVDAIARLISDANLGENVVVVSGFRAPDEVRTYLAASDVVVSIPTSDQMSAAILEALACGATIVASPIEAYEELFRDDLAIPASVDSAEALADSIAKAAAIRASSETASARTKEWLRQTQSDDTVVGHVMEFYSGTSAL